MHAAKRIYRSTAALLILFILLLTVNYIQIRQNKADEMEMDSGQLARLAQSQGFIKWVDFTVPASAMEDPLKIDLSTPGSENHPHWIFLLSYLGTRYGGEWKSYKKSDLNALCEKLKNGETPETLTANMKYYDYYHQAYEAVLGGFVGTWQRELPDRETGIPQKTEVYGLKVFSPIAEGYGYSHYDDFGVSRSYGYRRRHLGNDLLGETGTPIIAVESGIVEQAGWNQYGGWRIGIRSFDGKRYYYYAHLRKDHPFCGELKPGDLVRGGDVIGYLGMTGYSATENVNGMSVPHLHFGMQLIFDESQREGNGEIWIDVYQIVKFLARNRATVYRDPETKEFVRKYQVFDEHFAGYSD